MKRQLTLRLHNEIIIDGFAGGGGASLGIEWALGRSPDDAFNHDPEAIAMHAENHPNTRHHCGNIWDYDPATVVGNRRVALAWFSPDCTFHSKARGAKPFRDPKSAKGRRGLAWVVTRWARAVKPRVIILENVEEFADWGPLTADGRPDPERAGLTFRRWVGQLSACGYKVEWRELRACNFGAPTIRKRLFVIARCDGQPIVWPEPTHGAHRAKPWRTAAECIDWSLACPSIFLTREEARVIGVKRPLAEKTMARIARGVRRFVLESAEPFIAPVSHRGIGRRDHRGHGIKEPLRTITGARRGEFALVSPTLIQTGYGERPGQRPRYLDLHAPLGTIVGCGVRHALVASFLAKHYGGNEGPGVALSRPFLTRYNGEGDGQRANAPLGTVTSHDRFGLVTVAGEAYEIADIGMRMLVPRELYRAQGFPDSYVIDPVVDGERLSKTAQVRMVGNSVSPEIARALVAANVAALEVAA